MPPALASAGRNFEGFPTVVPLSVVSYQGGPVAVNSGIAKLDPAGAIPQASIHIGFAQHSLWRCDLNDVDGNSLHQWADSHDSTFSLLNPPAELLNKREFIRFWITIMKATDDPDEQIFIQVDLSQGGRKGMDPVQVNDKFDKGKHVYITAVEVTFEAA
jgi:hypothetical protein